MVVVPLVPAVEVRRPGPRARRTERQPKQRRRGKGQVRGLPREETLQHEATTGLLQPRDPIPTVGLPRGQAKELQIRVRGDPRGGPPRRTSSRRASSRRASSRRTSTRRRGAGGRRMAGQARHVPEAARRPNATTKTKVDAFRRGRIFRSAGRCRGGGAGTRRTRVAFDPPTQEEAGGKGTRQSTGPEDGEATQRRDST